MPIMPRRWTHVSRRGYGQYPGEVHCRQIVAAVKQGGTADGDPFVLDNENSKFSVGGVFVFRERRRCLCLFFPGDGVFADDRMMRVDIHENKKGEHSHENESS